MMKEETAKKICDGMFIFVFVTSILYIIYEPVRNILGSDYKSGWAFGLGLGLTFVPVLTWILNPIVNMLIKAGIIKDDTPD